MIGAFSAPPYAAMAGPSPRAASPKSLLLRTSPSPQPHLHDLHVQSLHAFVQQQQQQQHQHDTAPTSSPPIQTEATTNPTTSTAAKEAAASENPIEQMHEFWRSYFSTSFQIRWRPLLESLVLFFNEDLRMPLFLAPPNASLPFCFYNVVFSISTNVDWPASTTSTSLSPALSPSSSSSSSMDTEAHSPEFTAEFTAKSTAEAAVDDADDVSVSRDHVELFVRLWGPLRQAFFCAQENLFDEYGGMQPWFHGYALNSSATEQRLRAQRDPTFLVRLGTQQHLGTFSVLYWSGHTLEETILWRTPTGFQRHNDDTVYPSIPAFLAQHMSHAAPLPSTLATSSYPRLLHQPFSVYRNYYSSAYQSAHAARAAQASLVELAKYNEIVRHDMETIREWSMRCFFYAISVRDEMAVRRSIFEQVDLTAADKFGLNCLHVACAFNHARIFGLLYQAVPQDLSRGITARPICIRNATSLTRHTVHNRLMPYFRADFRLQAGMSLKAIASQYQSHCCLAYMDRVGGGY